MRAKLLRVLAHLKAAAWHLREAKEIWEDWRIRQPGQHETGLAQKSIEDMTHAVKLRLASAIYENLSIAPGPHPDRIVVERERREQRRRKR